MAAGLHIAVEGIDGSGVTTHSKLLVERLSSMGYRVVYFKEPTSGPVGKIIRALLKTENPRQELLALLFAADRVWNYYEANPSIASVKSSGGIAVSDRYKYSSLAYQGVALGYEWVACVNSRVPPADIVVYLDVPVEVAIRRVGERDFKETFEKREFLEKVKESYEHALLHAEREGTRVIRVSEVRGGLERPIEEVSLEILRRVVNAISDIL